MLQSEREKNESHSVFPQLETKFKDDTNKIMTEREKPFRCAVKFSSTNLLESLRHCASTGMNKKIATGATELFKKIRIMHNLDSDCCHYRHFKCPQGGALRTKKH